jgi:hypothetical protein
MSEFETNDKIEALCERGIDPKFIKTQAGVHNKGIIVDSSVVVVGSQNWSERRSKPRCQRKSFTTRRRRSTGSSFSITIGSTWPILRAWTEFLTRTRSR